MCSSDLYFQDFKKLHELDSNLIFHDLGVPDGATMDCQNNYWSARVRGNCIICIDIKKEKVLTKINLPTATPTCLTFGGPNSSNLFVTSLRAEPVNDNADGNLYKVETSTKGQEQLLSEI